MHLSVCIITFKRNVWLRDLLLALQRQKTDGRFTYSIVVVDNDRCESARPTVESVRRQAEIEIRYDTEARQNLALARNKAIQNASGEFLAFIDDDEVPEDDWLYLLLTTLLQHPVSGVLAPVVPRFEQIPPKWIIRGKIFDRPRYPTGYELHWRQTRTGNVLIDRRILESDADLFDARFAMHGEDLDFFRRAMAKGHRFIWCDEAVAYEIQPASRLRRRYHLRRALLRGSVFYSHVNAKLPSVLKSVLALVVYLPVLPLLQLFGHHQFMKFFIKCGDHFGKLLACAGYRVELHAKKP